MIQVFKLAVFCVAILLANHNVFADNRQGYGRDKYRKPHRAVPHRVHKPKPVYKIRRPHRTPPSHSQHRWHEYYKPGYGTRYLPHGYSRLRVGKLHYFFFDGYFFRPFRNEYRIVDAPIGAIVLSLPRLHFSLQWNGINYFRAGNTFYRHHPKGYIVVGDPGFRERWR